MRNAFGSRTIARPIATRWRWPPESSAGLRSSSSSSPSVVATSSDAAVTLGLRHMTEPQAERRDSRDGHVRVERVVLKHHREVAVLGPHVGDVVVADEDAAGGDRLEARDHPQERRLAAAGRADEHHELAVARSRADVVEGLRLVRIDLRRAVEPDPRHVSLRGSGTAANGARSRERSGRAPTRSAASSTAPATGSTSGYSGCASGMRDRRTERRSGEGWRRTLPQRTSGNGAPSCPVRDAQTRGSRPSGPRPTGRWCARPCRRLPPRRAPRPRSAPPPTPPGLRSS